jgi:hypothetical protein
VLINTYIFKNNIFNDYFGIKNIFFRCDVSVAVQCLNDFVFLESKYSFRYFNIVEVSQEKTTTYDKNSFKYTAAILWNDLPDDI